VSFKFHFCTFIKNRSNPQLVLDFIIAGLTVTIFHREKVIKLIEWPIFDKIILFFIAVNCILLTIDDPVCKCANSEQCLARDSYNLALYSSTECANWPTIKAILDASEIVFTALFTAEVALRTAAQRHPTRRRLQHTFQNSISDAPAPAHRTNRRYRVLAAIQQMVLHVDRRGACRKSAPAPSPGAPCSASSCGDSSRERAAGSRGSARCSAVRRAAVTVLRRAQMVLKIFARGFVMHKHAYLRDPWNWLDFGARAPRPPASPALCSPACIPCLLA
jgi:hypothetical protein